jgi:hypothetical protein
MATDLLAYLTASDTLKISKVSFHYAVSPDVVNPGDILVYDICPQKPKGKLLMDFDLSKFGIPGLNFHAAINGADAGLDGAGNRLIQWSVNQNVGTYVPILDATIDSIAGQFTTVLTEISPAVKQTSCDNTDRFYAVIFSPTGNNNGFVLKGHKNISPGVDVSATVTITDLRVEGVAGEPLSVSVRIKTPGTPCDKPIVEGGTAESFAMTSGVPLNVPVTYKWQITGGNVIGPDNQWRVKYSVPVSPVQVAVTVTAGGQTAFDSTPIFALPNATAFLLQKLCALRTIVHRNLFVDPLWDPLRDFVAKPISPAEKKHVAAFAQEITKLANEIERLTKTR